MNPEPFFKSTHGLPFEVAPWKWDDFSMFRIGTCEGLWRATVTSYDILTIINKRPGNGHLSDVFDWFEQSCIRDNKNLQILEILNQRFGQHLIEKRGFTATTGTSDLIKRFSI